MEMELARAAQASGVERYSSSRRDAGSGVEQNRCTFDVAAGAIRTIADEVQQRLTLPFHQVGAHNAI